MPRTIPMHSRPRAAQISHRYVASPARSSVGLRHTRPARRFGLRSRTLHRRPRHLRCPGWRCSCGLRGPSRRQWGDSFRSVRCACRHAFRRACCRSCCCAFYRACCRACCCACRRACCRACYHACYRSRRHPGRASRARCTRLIRISRACRASSVHLGARRLHLPHAGPSRSPASLRLPCRLAAARAAPAPCLLAPKPRRHGVEEPPHRWMPRQPRQRRSHPARLGADPAGRHVHGHVHGAHRYPGPCPVEEAHARHGRARGAELRGRAPRVVPCRRGRAWWRDVSSQYGGGTRHVQLVRGRDETCPVSTGGRTRHVQLVQREGEGGGQGTRLVAPTAQLDARDSSFAPRGAFPGRAAAAAAAAAGV